MGRWSSLVLYFLVGAPLIAGGHYYLWSRLIRNVGFTLPTERALTALLCGLAVSIPIAVVTSRLVPPDWSRWWVTPVYLWIGVACLLVLCVGAVDVLRTGYTFATSGLGRPDADRRQALARLAAISAAAVGLLVSGWAALEGRKVRVKRVEVPLKKLPRAFDGLRIVQLSDVHVGPPMRFAAPAEITHIVLRAG